eukprot:SM000376S13703  [mRNA]  locus=s376:31968:34778:- [translate_table: standard]
MLAAQLEEHLRALQDEQRKIEAFKRELPLCMGLLDEGDALGPLLCAHASAGLDQKCHVGAVVLTGACIGSGVAVAVAKRRLQSVFSRSSAHGGGGDGDIAPEARCPPEEPGGHGSAAAEPLQLSQAAAASPAPKGDGSHLLGLQLPPTAVWHVGPQLWNQWQAAGGQQVTLQAEGQQALQTAQALQELTDDGAHAQVHLDGGDATGGGASHPAQRRPLGAFTPFSRSSSSPGQVYGPPSQPPKRPSSLHHFSPTSTELALGIRGHNGGLGFGASTGYKLERSASLDTGERAVLERGRGPLDRSSGESSDDMRARDGGSHSLERVGSGNLSPRERKVRRCWSPELHRRFVEALKQLGGPRMATPKHIRELMKVDGLTNDEVKSHLQKYRLHTRRPSPSLQLQTLATAGSGGAAQQLMVLGSIWVPPGYTQALPATTAAASQGAAFDAPASGPCMDSGPVPSLERNQQQHVLMERELYSVQPQWQEPSSYKRPSEQQPLSAAFQEVGEYPPLTGVLPHQSRRRHELHGAEDNPAALHEFDGAPDRDADEEFHARRRAALSTSRGRSERVPGGTSGDQARDLMSSFGQARNEASMAGRGRNDRTTGCAAIPPGSKRES